MTAEGMRAFVDTGGAGMSVEKAQERLFQAKATLKQHQKIAQYKKLLNRSNLQKHLAPGDFALTQDQYNHIREELDDINATFEAIEADMIQLKGAKDSHNDRVRQHHARINGYVLNLMNEKTFKDLFDKHGIAPLINQLGNIEPNKKSQGALTEEQKEQLLQHEATIMEVQSRISQPDVYAEIFTEKNTL